MNKLIVVGTLFGLAGLCEIGGGCLVWGWMRESKPLFWALIGAGVLALYGAVAAMQPISAFGRVYAAYGGIFIVFSPFSGAYWWRASGPTSTTFWARSWRSREP